MKILIPYNFTENDKKSIGFVCHEYLDKQGAEIILFHAFTPVPWTDTRNNPIMEKLNRPASYLKLQQDEQKKVLEQVKQRLVDHGFDTGSVQCRFVPVKQDVAADIMQLVRAEKCDAVILNRNPGNIVNYFSRSISKRLTRHFGSRIRIHIAN